MFCLVLIFNNEFVFSHSHLLFFIKFIFKALFLLDMHKFYY
ncbi:hypothetical protein BBU64B_J0027 (plasmid) [Borreliella burgdorferi 64b]|nr:hypothetical protein BBU64B_J0027 [Borreliella burgdorferi 64b]